MCFNLYIYLLNVNVCKYTLIHDVGIYRYIYRDIDIVNIFQIYPYLNSGFFWGGVVVVHCIFIIYVTRIYIYIYICVIKSAFFFFLERESLTEKRYRNKI